MRYCSQATSDRLQMVTGTVCWVQVAAYRKSLRTGCQEAARSPQTSYCRQATAASMLRAGCRQATDRSKTGFRHTMNRQRTGSIQVSADAQQCSRLRTGCCSHAADTRRACCEHAVDGHKPVLAPLPLSTRKQSDERRAQAPGELLVKCPGASSYVQELNNELRQGFVRYLQSKRNPSQQQNW